MVFVPALGFAAVGSLVKEGRQNRQDDDEQDNGEIDPFLHGYASLCPNSASAIFAERRNDGAVLVKRVRQSVNDATDSGGNFLACMARVLIQKTLYSISRQRRVCLCGMW